MALARNDHESGIVESNDEYAHVGRERRRVLRNPSASWSHPVAIRLSSIPLFWLVPIPRHVLADSIRQTWVTEGGEGGS